MKPWLKGVGDRSRQAFSDSFDQAVTDLDGGQRHPELCPLAHGIPEHGVELQPTAAFKIGEAYHKQIPTDWFLAPPSYEKDQGPVLDALRIPYLIVRKEKNIRQGIRRCLTTLSATNYHVAMIMGAEVCVEDL